MHPRIPARNCRVSLGTVQADDSRDDLFVTLVTFVGPLIGLAIVPLTTLPLKSVTSASELSSLAVYLILGTPFAYVIGIIPAALGAFLYVMVARLKLRFPLRLLAGAVSGAAGWALPVALFDWFLSIESYEVAFWLLKVSAAAGLICVLLLDWVRRPLWTWRNSSDSPRTAE